MASGIRIAQDGVDVRRAAEYQLALDNRWPFLEFEYVGEVSLAETIVNKNVFLPFYTHRLGFLPGFFLLIKTSLDDINYSEVVAVDDKIGFNIFSSASTTNVNFRAWLAVLKRDISKEYKSGSGHVTPGPFSGPQRHGIKITRPGGSLRSKRKIDYSLNTNAKSLAIHQHGIATASSATNDELRITHDMGYPPTYFIAQRKVEAGSANPILGKTSMECFNNGTGKSSSTATKLTIEGAQAALAGDFAYLILKDPVDVAR